MKKAIIFLLLASVLMTVKDVKTAEGQLSKGVDVYSLDGVHDKLYEFTADDGSIRWTIKGSDLKEAPEDGEKYILIYSNNGTTECPDADTDDCLCYLYDDTFIGIKKVKT